MIEQRRGERLWSAAWALGWAFLTAAPYLAARLAAPEGHRYLWLLPPIAEDSLAYLAWARQAYLGAFLLKFKFTPIHHAPFLVQPFFFLVGRAAAWGGWELGVVQLAFKSLGVVLFWAAFQRLARRLGFTGSALWSAAILTGFGAGLGGALLIVLGVKPLIRHMPIDIWFIDSNTLWSLTWNALFPYSLALILFFIEALDRASSGEEARWAWLGGVAAALLLLVHPYTAPLLAFLTLAATAWRRRPQALWGLVVPAAPVAAYVAWMSLTNPLVMHHGEMGRMLTPSWPAILLGLAPALALASWGLAVGGKTFARRHGMLLLWVAGALLLSRLPVWFQRKVLFGIQIPLSLLAGAGVVEIAERLGGGRRLAAGLVATAVALALPSWAYIGYNTRLSLSVHEGSRYYAPEPVMAALEFLSRQGTPDQVVLSSSDAGGLVAMVAGKTAVWGHWAQSVDFRENELWFERLVTPGDPRAKAGLLWGKADYVFAEGDLKREIDAGRLRWLKGEARLLYSNPDASIYAPRPR